MAQQRFDKDRKKSFGGYGKPKGDHKRPYGGSPRNERSDYDRDERPADFADSDEVTGLIVGRNPVMEALKSGKALDTIYVIEMQEAASVPLPELPVSVASSSRT